MINFDGLNHFTPKENWGDPELMDTLFLRELDALRSWLGLRMVVSCGTQGEHKSRWHSLGIAADIIIPEVKLDELPDIMLDALRFDFQGVGIYPHWQLKGRRTGGIHLDFRPSQTQKSLWIGVPGEDGKTKYIAASWKNFIKYF